MRILRINNVLTSEMEPSIKTSTGEWWYLNDVLHRAIGPAVINTYSRLYYFRGIRINSQIQEGKLSVLDILEIENAEVRQVAMEILGYEKFLNIFAQIDAFTPECFLQENPKRYAKKEMYRLFAEKISSTMVHPVKILAMTDAHKDTEYYIRVSPLEKTCKEALAHSYSFDSYEDYIAGQ